MKQQDIALIIIAVGISGLLSFVLGNVLLGGTKRSAQVQVVKPVTSKFLVPEAGSRYFNELSLNPTKEITIGEDGNPVPFKGTSQP